MTEVTSRRRKLLAFMVLTMLLYGRHSSVEWTGAWQARVTTAKFGRDLGVGSYWLRRACEWLKRYKYITHLEVGHGYMVLTLRPPLERTPSDAARQNS